MNFKRFSVFIVVCLLIVAAGFFSYRDGYWRWHQQELAHYGYAVRGLDVSHHQGVIDWTSVARDGISFAYIKATEGGDFRDPLFKLNWQGALDAGLDIGAYHFFTLCRSGAEQAENLIETVPISPSEARVIVDVEYVGNCARRPSAEKFQHELLDFINRVEVHFGRDVLIYTTQEFHRDYLSDDKFSGRDYWVRSVWGDIDEILFPSWEVWQYADNGVVDGIHGVVDLNVRR